MGKDDKEATRKELEEKLKLQTAGEKSYFNKPLLLFGIITFITGLNHYFKWYPLPEIFIDIILNTARPHNGDCHIVI